MKITIGQGLFTIRIPATEEDLLQRGAICAELNLELQKLEEEKKAKMQEFKTAMDSIKDKTADISQEIREKKVTIRNAKCKEIIDNETEMYQMVWGDVIVEERPMTPEEKQKFTSGIFTPANNHQDVGDDIKNVIRLESSTKTKTSHV
jgi:DNA primase catalytic subunit